jgi:DNA-binding transcriptional ArsR family regulator
VIDSLGMKLSLMDQVLSACANQKRLEILKFIKQKKYGNVSEIAKGINLSIKSTSKHLALLHSRHIIKREPEGVIVYYSLNRPLNPIAKNIIHLL